MGKEAGEIRGAGPVHEIGGTLRDVGVLRLCTVDPEPLIPLLDGYPWPPGGANFGEFANNDIDPFPSEFMAAVDPIIKRVLDHLPGRRLGPIWLSKFKPLGEIPKHTDSCDMKIHVPLITNPETFFWVNFAVYVMAVGFAWVLDSRHVHTIENNGTTDRVHLIFDAVA